MNKLVIVILIAACFMEVLSTRTVVRSRKRTARTAKTTPTKTLSTKKTSLIAKPISNENPKIDTSKSTDSKSTPLAEIPYIASDMVTLITGVDGKISVNGVPIYEDEKFKNGQVHWKVTGSNVYINGNLVAKNPQNGTVDLSNHKLKHENIKKFEMKIFDGGYWQYGDDQTSSSWWL